MTRSHPRDDLNHLRVSFSGANPNSSGTHTLCCNWNLYEARLSRNHRRFPKHQRINHLAGVCVNQFPHAAAQMISGFFEDISSRVHQLIFNTISPAAARVGLTLLWQLRISKGPIGHHTNTCRIRSNVELRPLIIPKKSRGNTIGVFLINVLRIHAVLASCRRCKQIHSDDRQQYEQTPKPITKSHFSSPPATACERKQTHPPPVAPHS